MRHDYGPRHANPALAGVALGLLIVVIAALAVVTLWLVGLA